MGFLWGVFGTFVLIWFAVSYLTSRDERSKINREFAAAPVKSALAFAGLFGMVGFFLGIFIQPLGKIRIGVEGLALPLWQACGIVGALCVVIHMLVENRR